MILTHGKFALLSTSSSGPASFNIRPLTTDRSPYPALISHVQSKGYTLKNTIPAMIHFMDGLIYVVDDMNFTWGSGKTFEEAKLDYELNLIDCYETLTKNEHRLSQMAQDEMAKLEYYLGKLN